MSEGVLTVLKFCLLAVLYLFLARVVWTVTTELRGTPASAPPVPPPAPSPAAPTRGTRRGKQWRVTIVQPETERGATYAVDGELTIGRAAGCAITLSGDTFVSQVHARVFEHDGDLFVEDLNSTNGTALNNRPVEGATKLKRGDRISIGRSELEVGR